MRAFLAIELPADVAHAMASAAVSIRDTDRAWAGEKWVGAGLLHITLKFLGDVDARCLEELSEGFGRVATNNSEFSLRLDRLRAVPHARRASMIWSVAEKPSAACSALAADLDRAASQAGVPPERREFTAHVTLVRARRPRPISPDVLATAADVSGLAAVPDVSVPAFTLYESTLTPKGPIHQRLRRFELCRERRPKQGQDDPGLTR